jgi:hypothetical protein
METRVAIGVAWYTPDGWKDIKEMSEDSDTLHDSYQEWLREARWLEKTLRKQGHDAERVMVQPATFRAWCMARGLRIDASARSDS